MNIRILLLLCCVFFVFSGEAEIKLPHILADNMVFQQQSDVKLWGEATPNRKVVVKTSWSKKKYSCTSDEKGKWLLTVPTPVASFTPQCIEISDGKSVKLTNILIGEVWLAGGQSNMEMPVAGFENCPVEGANEVIAHSGQYKDRIRFVKIPRVQSYEPETDVDCKWLVSSPERTPWVSAAAFFFAENLTKVLNVPVGIIDCNWGGSPVECWMDRKTLEGYGNVSLDKKEHDKMYASHRPLVMYNAMIHPLVNYTLKGFLWYQGEANLGNYPVYAQRMADMVALWRKDWGLGNLPFYYVEIAPYVYDGEMKTIAANMREQQFMAQRMIANSGMVSTNDLVYDYEVGNIHPAQKRKVGERLSYLALAEAYGVKGIYTHGPEYKSAEFKEGKAYVTFNHVENGFSRLKDIEGFEVCGEDRVFYPAVAHVERFSVVVQSDKVKHPVAVRYCFHNFQLGNLKGAFGLPVVPFRSDSF